MSISTSFEILKEKETRVMSIILFLITISLDIGIIFNDEINRGLTITRLIFGIFASVTFLKRFGFVAGEAKNVSDL